MFSIGLVFCFLFFVLFVLFCFWVVKRITNQNLSETSNIIFLSLSLSNNKINKIK